MDQLEFRKMKEAGELVDDAGLREAETEITPDDRFEEEVEEEATQEAPEDDEQEETDAGDEEPEEEELTPKEKDAFTRRMERERAKLEEKLRKEVEEQTEQKYSKLKEAVDHLGGDPEKILAAAREAKMLQDAQALANRNGWDEEETRYYIEQQKKDQRLKELEVKVEVNRLKDQPEYQGIERMQNDIQAKIDKSNGALTVEEAYWALGGPKRAEQVKMEAQQREINKRGQTPRTVVKDTPSTSLGEKPLPPSVLRDAKLMGISEAEARRLHNSTAANDIDSWREQKKKQAK